MEKIRRFLHSIICVNSPHPWRFPETANFDDHIMAHCCAKSINRFLDAIKNGEDVIYRGAPHMIVAATPKNAPCAEADPWIALSYFDLLVQSYGLGSCWCGFAVHAFKWNRTLRKRLNLPKGYKIAAVLLFGKPDVNYHRATKPENFKINV